MPSRPLFVTQLYEADLAAERGWADLAAELDQAVRGLAAEDRAGRAWAREHAYPGYTSYASLDDLPRRMTAFDQLRRRLDRHVAAFAQDAGFELHGGRLKLDSLWVNLLKPGGHHSAHLHPHSAVSGTLYLATPPGAGAIRFEDPRLPALMAAPQRRADAPEPLRTFVTVEPRPGLLLLWESWLRHEVLPGRARGGPERLSVSFNYA